MRKTFIQIIAAGFILAAAVPALMILNGWWTYHKLEKSIIEKMDQYYLNISTPGREEYLLQGDEVFEVPYMASKLSVAAAPTRIYDAQGRLIGEYITEKGLYVRDPDDLPAFLKKALIATEDGTFYSHHGVNYRALARAIVVNIRHMHKAQGGSTITQQLAKMMFTTRQKTFGRKIFEVFCAMKLEEKFTKDQILLMYFNFAYFGHGCFGVESASQFYFGKPARDLQLAEAAMLVGLIASPNNYSPFQHLDLAKARHRTVLARMARLGFIPANSVERYANDFWDTMDTRFKSPAVSFWRMRVNEAPYVIETVRRKLEKEFPKERILKGGLKIYTTIDIEMQKAAERAVREGLRDLNEHRPDGDEDPESPIQGALMAVNPQDGAILAMVGGAEFSFQNQLNRAVDTARPIGSTVKPFVYALAFESGLFRPDDKLVDEPVKFKNWSGSYWEPHNYGNKYYGEVTLADALRKSLNSVTIQVLSKLKIGEEIALLAEATGETKKHFPRNLTLGLGTMDLSTTEVAALYSVLDNGGKTVHPQLIRYIEDRSGNKVRDYSSHPAAESILKPETCATMVKVMQGVFAEGGSAHAAALRTGFNIPAAGKTGTTNDSRDAWFTGFTPDVVATVWVGHDDMRVALGSAATGGGFAAPIWMNFIKEIYRNRPTREFEVPTGNK